MLENISQDRIKSALDSHISIPEGTTHQSSVLMPIVKTENGYEFIFCRRSMALKHQPGDVCFPGGSREGSESPVETALRETEEEIGIGPENIKVLGETDFVVSISGAVIYSFVGMLDGKGLSDIKINGDEVEEVFTVPVQFFIDNEPEIHYVDARLDIPDDFPFEYIVGGKNYKWGKGQQAEMFYFYNGHIIWGFTARIVKNFCSIIEGKI